MYVWSKLQNVNIQPLLGVVLFQGELGVVSPWMEQGDLDQYLRDQVGFDRYKMVSQTLPALQILSKWFVVCSIGFRRVVSSQCWDGRPRFIEVINQLLIIK